MEWTPKIWYLVEIFEILLLHVLSNDACKFATNLFPITWGPFGNVNLLYFLLKMQIWNGCNVLNIVGNPIKDINVNLSFLSSRWKVVKWTPQDWKIFKFISELRINSCGMDPQDLTSGGNFWNSTFTCMANDACKFATNPFPITWGPFENVNLLLFSIENADLKWL